MTTQYESILMVAADARWQLHRVEESNSNVDCGVFLMYAAYFSASCQSGFRERVSGHTLTIASSRGGVSVDGAKVVKTDIGVSNGVIHVIDSVILPEDE